MQNSLKFKAPLLPVRKVKVQVTSLKQMNDLIESKADHIEQIYFWAKTSSQSSESVDELLLKFCEELSEIKENKHYILISEVINKYEKDFWEALEQKTKLLHSVGEYRCYYKRDGFDIFTEHESYVWLDRSADIDFQREMVDYYRKMAEYLEFKINNQ